MTTGSGTGEDGRLRRGVELLRRHPGAIVVVAVLGLVVVGIVNRASDDSGNDETHDSEPVHQRASRDAADREEATSAPETESSTEEGAADGSDAADRAGTTITTLFPPDVARPRPPVDLEAPPDGSDPVEVARWWAAVYVSYVGAEPAEELAQRLEPLTTPSMRQDLASMPPSASYNEPIPIEGVTANELAGGSAGSGSGEGQSQQKMRVVVETPDAVVVYDLVLEHAAPGWQVSEVTLL